MKRKLRIAEVMLFREKYEICSIRRVAIVC